MNTLADPTEVTTEDTELQTTNQAVQTHFVLLGVIAIAKGDTEKLKRMLDRLEHLIITANKQIEREEILINQKNQNFPKKGFPGIPKKVVRDLRKRFRESQKENLMLAVKRAKNGPLLLAERIKIEFPHINVGDINELFYSPKLSL